MIRVLVGEDDCLGRAVERHVHSIFSKLDLGDSEHFSRRVKAALRFLAANVG